MAFHPYLNFAGSCREAFTRYQEIFGGDMYVLGFDEMPEGADVPPGVEGMAAHAALTTPDGQLLMGSDEPGDPQPPHGMWVNYDAADADDARRVFTALADGGTVEMDLAETFWSPAFGMCRDRFGTPWMVSAPGEGEPPSG